RVQGVPERQWEQRPCSPASSLISDPLWRILTVEASLLDCTLDDAIRVQVCIGNGQGARPSRRRGGGEVLWGAPEQGARYWAWTRRSTMATSRETVAAHEALGELAERLAGHEAAVLIDALRADQAARWRAGAGPPAEDYLRAFPALCGRTEDALLLI